MFMDKNSKTKNLLIKHYKKYPKLQIQDILKFLFQSSFGCEHMISSLDFVTDYITKEASSIEQKNAYLVEQLDGKYSRVNLLYLKKGLSPYTLGKLFYASAKKEVNGLEKLKDQLIAVKELIHDGSLPFSIEDFYTAVNEWSHKGYPAIHHSKIFRDEYSPSYRVIANRYIPFLPLFSEIDKIQVNSSALIIIHDNINKKTNTMIETLLEIYDCKIINNVDNNMNQQNNNTQTLINYYSKFKCSLFSVKSAGSKTETLTIIKQPD